MTKNRRQSDLWDGMEYDDVDVFKSPMVDSYDKAHGVNGHHATLWKAQKEGSAAHANSARRIATTALQNRREQMKKHGSEVVPYVSLNPSMDAPFDPENPTAHHRYVTQTGYVPEIGQVDLTYSGTEDGKPDLNSEYRFQTWQGNGLHNLHPDDLAVAHKHFGMPYQQASEQPEEEKPAAKQKGPKPLPPEKVEAGVEKVKESWNQQPAGDKDDTAGFGVTDDSPAPVEDPGDEVTPEDVAPAPEKPKVPQSGVRQVHRDARAAQGRRTGGGQYAMMAITFKSLHDAKSWINPDPENLVVARASFEDKALYGRNKAYVVKNAKTGEVFTEEQKEQIGEEIDEAEKLFPEDPEFNEKRKNNPNRYDPKVAGGVKKAMGKDVEVDADKDEELEELRVSENKKQDDLDKMDDELFGPFRPGYRAKSLDMSVDSLVSDGTRKGTDDRGWAGYDENGEEASPDPDDDSGDDVLYEEDREIRAEKSVDGGGGDVHVDINSHDDDDDVDDAQSERESLASKWNAGSEHGDEYIDDEEDFDFGEDSEASGLKSSAMKGRIPLSYMESPDDDDEPEEDEGPDPDDAREASMDVERSVSGMTFKSLKDVKSWENPDPKRFVVVATNFQERKEYGQNKKYIVQEVPQRERTGLGGNRIVK